MANRNFTYYYQYFDKKLKFSFSSYIGLDECSMANMMMKQSIKTCKLNELCCPFDLSSGVLFFEGAKI